MIARQRGMALLTVLLMIAMMMVLAMAAQRSWVNALRQATTLQFSQQAKWTLLGAEQWLLVNLPEVPTPRQQALILEGETVHYRWRDQQRCYNLNALIVPGKTDEEGQYWPTAAQQVFINLLSQQGLSRQQADESVQRIAASLNPGQQPEVRPLLDDKTQLRALSILPGEMWQSLSPLVCALSETKLNINLNALTAEEAPLLSALLGRPLDAGQIATVLSRKPAQGWPDVSAFVADLPIDATEAASTLQSVAVFSSSEWELQLWIARENRIAALRTRVAQQAQGMPVIRYREFGLSE